MSNLTNKKLTTKRLLTGFLVGLGFMGLAACSGHIKTENKKNFCVTCKDHFVNPINDVAWPDLKPIPIGKLKTDKQSESNLGNDNFWAEVVVAKEIVRQAGEHAYAKLMIIKTYCPQQYNNLFDKAIQEEGRKQLGQRPSNQRLTLEEMKRVDWTKVNFSEVIKGLEIKLAGNLGK
jgi:hypothetical protein